MVRLYRRDLAAPGYRTDRQFLQGLVIQEDRLLCCLVRQVRALPGLPRPQSVPGLQGSPAGRLPRPYHLYQRVPLVLCLQARPVVPRLPVVLQLRRCRVVQNPPEILFCLSPRLPPGCR